MNRTRALILIIAALVGAVGGIAGYIWITGGSGEASISAADALATRTVEDARLADAVGTAVSDAISQTLPDAINAAVGNVVDSAVSSAIESMLPNEVELSIVAAESQASFTMAEDLRGVRTTVIGATSDVAGNITMNLSNPADSVIGAIVINARTLTTDNDFRNRALRSRILRSAEDQYEFIVFEPRSLGNFSADSVGVGETISFDISGDLSVVDATREVTFRADVTLDSETQISGRAATTVLYADFGLVIPSVPGVANVTDDAELALEFVARAE